MSLKSSHVVDLLSEHGHLLDIAGALRQREEDLISSLRLSITEVSILVASDAPGKVHVLLLHSHALGVDGAQVRVLEQTDNVGLRSLLESLKSLGLESELVVHVHSDTSDQSLEASSGQEHIGGLLVALDLPKGDRARLEAHLSPLFDATVGRGVLLDHLASLADLHGHLGSGLSLRSNLGLGHSTVGKESLVSFKF